MEPDAWPPWGQIAFAALLLAAAIAVGRVGLRRRDRMEHEVIRLDVEARGARVLSVRTFSLGGFGAMDSHRLVGYEVELRLADGRSVVGECVVPSAEGPVWRGGWPGDQAT